MLFDISRVLGCISTGLLKVLNSVIVANRRVERRDRTIAWLLSRFYNLAMIPLLLPKLADTSRLMFYLLLFFSLVDQALKQTLAAA